MLKTSEAEGQVIAYRVPLEVDGVAIRPGDIVFGDTDGVVVVPKEIEAEVIAEALERSRREKMAKEELLRGHLATDVFLHCGIL